MLGLSGAGLYSDSVPVLPSVVGLGGVCVDSSLTPLYDGIPSISTSADVIIGASAGTSTS